MAQRNGTVETMVGRTPTFWRGKRVFLTGHTGFKGSWLALWLHRLGSQVTGFALPPETEPSLFVDADVGALVANHFTDVRDPIALTETMSAAAPEIVFHLAAQSLVRRSYREPVATFAVNVMGTAHVLEAVRSVPSVRAVVVVTTDKCYENSHSLGAAFREGDPLGGQDPYSGSKAAAEIVTAAYRSSYFAPSGGVRLATARAGNVIGGGDWAEDRLIPDLIRGWATGSATPIRYPDATRPWQHVLEPLAGYLRLGERLYEGDDGAAAAWNFGPDPAGVQRVRDVADGIVARLGPPAEWCHERGVHPNEAPLLCLDSTKARAELGWRPRWSFEQTLEHTARWYQRRQSARSVDAIREACMIDFDDYERLG